MIFGSGNYVCSIGGVPVDTLHEAPGIHQKYRFIFDTPYPDSATATGNCSYPYTSLWGERWIGAERYHPTATSVWSGRNGRFYPVDERVFDYSFPSPMTASDYTQYVVAYGSSTFSNATVTGNQYCVIANKPSTYVVYPDVPMYRAFAYNSSITGYSGDCFPGMFYSTKNMKYVDVTSYTYNSSGGHNQQCYQLCRASNVERATVANTYLYSPLHLHEAFAECSRLKEVRIDSNYASLRNTFYGCTALTSVVLNINHLSSDRTATGNNDWRGTLVGTFQNCYSLTEMPNLPYSDIDVGAARARNAFNSTFYGCRGLSGYVNLQLCSSFQGEYEATFYSTFAHCFSITGARIGLPEPRPPSQGTLLELYDTFSGCDSLKEATLDNLGRSENLRYTFEGCSSLTSINGYTSIVDFADNLPADNMPGYLGTFKGCTSFPDYEYCRRDSAYYEWVTSVMVTA